MKRFKPVPQPKQSSTRAFADRIRKLSKDVIYPAEYGDVLREALTVPTAFEDSDDAADHPSAYRFFRKTKKGSIGVSFGLTPHADAAIAANGQALPTLTIPECLFLPKQDEAFLQELVEDDRPVIEAVCSKARGQLLATNSERQARIIGLICGLYSSASIGIVTGSNAAAKRLQQRLEQQFEGEVMLNEALEWKNPKVAVLNQSVAGSIQHWDFQVLIYADRNVAIAMNSLSAYPSMRRCPIFLVDRIGAPPDQLDAYTSMLIAGPVIYEDQKLAGQTTAVRVEFDRSIPEQPMKARGALERKIKGIWHNGVRNRGIASLAQAFTNGDAKVIVEHGLLLDQPHDVIAEPRSTVIVVETVEHARRLQKMLPGWDIAQRAMDMRTDGERDYDWYIPPVTERSIATLMILKERTLQCEVIIRADGTGSGLDGEIELPTERCSRGLNEVLLVDIANHVDFYNRDAVQLRVRNYIGNNYTVRTIPK